MSDSKRNLGEKSVVLLQVPPAREGVSSHLGESAQLSSSPLGLENVRDGPSSGLEAHTVRGQPGNRDSGCTGHLSPKLC